MDIKQHVTYEQYDQLNPLQKEKLFNFFFPNVPKRHDVDGKAWSITQINPEYLTIGRLIQFLGVQYWSAITYVPKEYSEEVLLTSNLGVHPNELCDKLWSAVKYALAN